MLRGRKKNYLKKRVLSLLTLVLIIAAVTAALNYKTVGEYIGNVFAKSDSAVNAFNNSSETPQATSLEAVTPGKAQATPTATPGVTPAVEAPSKTGQSSISSVNYDELKNKVINASKKYKGVYGIYFKTIDGTGSFGINENEVYDAASTAKVPINLYLYKLAAEGKVNLDTKVQYTKADYEDGTGQLQYRKMGTWYTLRELSSYSIRYSDNVATQMIKRQLGIKETRDFERELGGKVVDDDDNISSPKDMWIYLRGVYDFDKKYPALGKELLGYLKTTVYNDRIPALLPKSIEIAHKIGNQVGYIHDVGIIYGNKPYILCVMVKNTTDSDAKKGIAEISKIIYDYTQK